MKIWLTTDTHFGHDKMIEWCGRPSNHEEIILRELRKVPSDAILIHLGDICMGKDEYWNEQFHLNTAQCKKKILVRGNHDNKSDSWYLDRKWDFVCDTFSTKYFGKKILFSHIPQSIELCHDINIHGHLHNTDHRNYEHEIKTVLSPRHILLAIENTDLKPVNLCNFISLKNMNNEYK